MSSPVPTQSSANTVSAAPGPAARIVNLLPQYLDWPLAALRDEARRIPERMRALATARGAAEFDAQRLVDVAELSFDIKVQGKTLQTRVTRVLDVAYWRRTLRRRVAREVERRELQRGRVGKDGSAYCSVRTQAVRAIQREAQQQWLDEAKLQAVVDGERIELPMKSVAKTSHQKLSRLYAFVAAMDRLAEDGGLTVALLTATLASEWHPNPAHGKATHCWNGKTPAEASKEMGARWQNIRRDLDKRGIAVSGLWAAEPHRDGCPHRHFWLIYAPEHQREVFAAFLTHFPGKLKVRRDDAAGGDAMIETAAGARAGVSRPLKRKREGAQVDVSIIDRDKGSGASYVIKYVSKSIGAEGAFDGENAKPRSKREQGNLLAIDAYRSLWGMRGAQFFGIKNCLTLWDELRRVTARPVQPELAALWRAARGGEKWGRIEAKEQRGDAYAFLRLQGGLAAQPKELGARCARKAGPKARVYRSATLTQYGEEGARIEGVELVGPTQKVRRKKTPGAPKARRASRPRQVLERLPTHEVRWSMKPPEREEKPKPPSKLARAVAREVAPADAAGDS